MLDKLMGTKCPSSSLRSVHVLDLPHESFKLFYLLQRQYTMKKTSMEDEYGKGQVARALKIVTQNVMCTKV